MFVFPKTVYGSQNCQGLMAHQGLTLKKRSVDFIAITFLSIEDVLTKKLSELESDVK